MMPIPPRPPRSRTRAVTLVAALAAGVASCTHHPRYPITQESRPLTAVDAGETGTAPDVASRVGAERIARAAAEPQNWLTY